MLGRARVNPAAREAPVPRERVAGGEPAAPGQAPHGAGAHRAGRLPAGPGGESMDGQDSAACVLHRFGTSDRPRPVSVRVGSRGFRPPAARSDAELLARGTAHEGSEHS